MILDRFRLDGQVAVVTGAGRGIGAATAIALAEVGADLVIAARTPDQLEEVAEQVAAVGRKAHTVAVDLDDLEAAAGLAQIAYETFGRLDVVVNNVGGTVPRPLMHTKARYLEEAFHFNVSTAHELSRAAVPFMLRSSAAEAAAGASAGSERPGTADNLSSDAIAAASAGAIVNISSVMGRVADRGYLAYGTAKAALAHWTRLAAADLSPHIRVNAIAVGSVLTSALDFVAANEEMRGQMESSTPLGRLGQPEDIAAAVVYLSSRAGAYLTGKVLEVDGGLQSANLSLGLPDLELETAPTEDAP